MKPYPLSFLVVGALWLGSTAHASSHASFHTAPPPSQVTRASYESWLRSIHSNISAFTDLMFAWYDEQARAPLPGQVGSDPERLHVAVDRALRETIDLEQSGEIEEGNTVGFEAYGILDVPVDVALDTKLFTWGKPVGKRSGDTWPFDTVFAFVHNAMEETWGPASYLSRSSQTGGGFVQDLHDDYTILVRGDAKEGYAIFAAFLGPNAANTATLAHTSIVLLKPRADGRTEFRQNVRQNGQSYKIFGIEYGRKNFGFNVSRIRQGEKALVGMMLELKATGRIRENRPDGSDLLLAR